MRIVPYFLLLIVTLSFMSCSEDEPSINAQEQGIIEAFIDSSDLGATISENGIYEYLITANTNPSLNNTGDIFRIQYKLYDLEGTLISKVDSTTSDTLILVKKGSSAILPIGVDLALESINAGESKGFIIPSAKGYGKLDLTGIPPNTILHLIVTVVEVWEQSDLESFEQGIIQDYVYNNLSVGNEVRTLSQGFGMRYKSTSSPVSGTSIIQDDTISISYTLTTLDGAQIDAVGVAVPFKFVVGDEPSVMLGLEVGVKEMGLNEKAVLILPSSAAYGYSATVIPRYLIDRNVIAPADNPLITENILPTYVASIPPYQILRMDLEVVGIN